MNLTKKRTYLGIIFPQAFRFAVPVLGNTLISCLKNTSLIFNAGAST